MTRRDLPNLISALRLALIPPVVLALLGGHFGLALGLFALAGASDGVDGWLARRMGWQSRLGAFLDPLADKLMMLHAYGTLAWLGLLPPWLAVLVVGRDLLIAGGALAYRRCCGRIEPAPLLLSKLNTLVQIGFVLLLLCWLAFGVLGPLLGPGMLLVCLTTLSSGAAYVWVWGRKARQGVRHE